jgi:amino acid permease
LWELDDDGQIGRFASVYSVKRITILFWAVVMFPLSLQRDVSSLERFSPLGVFSIIFLVFAAIVHSISHGDANDKDVDTQQGALSTDFGSMMLPKSSWDVIRAFPIIIFAFSCQPNVCSIYQELIPADAPCDASNAFIIKSKQTAMRRITRNGILLCMTLYLGIGLFGYLDFTSNTLDNILNNYCIQKSHDALMIAASVFVAVAVVVAFPFNILPARVTLKLILERWRGMRRCHRCHKFNSSVTCGYCCSCCRMPPVFRPEYSRIASIDLDATSHLIPAQQNDELHADATDALLSDERFGNRPSLVPHLSLEGLSYIDEEVHSTESPPLEHFLLTLFLSGCALIIALLIPGISVVFGLMGGTSASIISFILPGMFMIDTHEYNGPSRREKVLPLLMVWGGTLIGIVTTYVTIHGLFFPAEGANTDTCTK